MTDEARDPRSDDHVGVAIVASMDARMDLRHILGVADGAHVVRHAGSVVADDAIRSVGLSQMTLGTREIVVIGRSGSGAAGKGGGHASVQQSIDKLRASPLVPYTDRVRGFVFDVDAGRLDEIG